MTAGPLTVIAVQALHAQCGHDAFSKALSGINLSGNSVSSWVPKSTGWINTPYFSDYVAGSRVLVSAPWEASMRLARRPSCHAAAMDLGSLCSSVCTLHR